MSEAMDDVIRAERLGKTYAEGSLRTPVFDGLEFRVAAGETVAILGASGAGKSTLLHLLGGLDVPTAGEVFVAGHRMSALSDAERGRLRNRALGFVYQFHHLLPEFTALENVMMPALIAGKSRREAKRLATELLERVGLKDRVHHKPGRLVDDQDVLVFVDDVQFDVLRHPLALGFLLGVQRQQGAAMDDVARTHDVAIDGQ